MKVQIVSDLHCDAYTDGGIKMLDELPVTGDVLVVAGDLCDHRGLVDAVDTLCAKFYEVVFVPGNHEYYFSDRGTVHNDRVKLERRFQNFHWLDRDVVEIRGQRFVGATGWFKNDPSNWMYENLLNDFRLIIGFKKWIYERHEEDKKFLLENARPGDVVITHHAPTEMSIHPRYKTSYLNRFYVGHFEEVIEKCNPKLWIHGHMHDAFDYNYLETRVVCNPKGIRYLGENVCNPEKLINLSTKTSEVC